VKTKLQTVGLAALAATMAAFLLTASGCQNSEAQTTAPATRPFAPKIAGMPSGWTRDHMIKFLETGEKPGGIVCGPPMPPYRFNHEDAIAVAEYLASLGKK
jgi:hypothetical protein